MTVLQFERSKVLQGFAMRIELPQNKKFVFQMNIPIRWGDMDMMGHVNNTLYFRYIETIRVEWLNSIGFPPNPGGQGPVIVNAFCNFYKQLEYPGELLLKMYTSDPGRTTFETWCTMEPTNKLGEIHAEGGGTTIWVDFKQKKATELPAHIRDLVSP